MEFREWLVQLNAADLEEVLPMGYCGIMFWDHAVWASEESERVERSIHQVLHPETSFEYETHCEQRGVAPLAEPAERRWLNAKCDVQAIWSHIHAENNIFVTEDKRFLTPVRKAQLIALGAGEIMTPVTAVARLLADQ